MIKLEIFPIELHYFGEISRSNRNNPMKSRNVIRVLQSVVMHAYQKKSTDVHKLTHVHDAILVHEHGTPHSRTDCRTRYVRQIR